MKRQKLWYGLFLLVFFSVCFYSCNTYETGITPTRYSYDALYRMAMKHVMTEDRNAVSDNLIPITDTNRYLNWKIINNEKYVLVSSMMPKKYINSYPIDSTVVTKYGEMWVTVVPELKDWFSNHSAHKANATLRCQQLLGLPRNEIDTFYFVEVWAKVQDLFRPSADSEINDTRAQIEFPSNVDTGYKLWFNNNLINLYYPDAGRTQYPWTRLGYTYDWADPSNNRGLSEFLIKKNCKIIINKVVSVTDYVK